MLSPGKSRDKIRAPTGRQADKTRLGLQPVYEAAAGAGEAAIVSKPERGPLPTSPSPTRKREPPKPSPPSTGKMGKAGGPSGLHANRRAEPGANSW